MTKFNPGILAALLGGVLLLAPKVTNLQVDWSSFGSWFRKAIPAPVVSYKDYTLVAVTEKTRKTVDQTIAIRKASEFVKSTGLAGYTVVDRDDPWASVLIANVKEKLKVEPPFLSLVKLKDDSPDSVLKAVPWKGPLEDVLK